MRMCHFSVSDDQEYPNQILKSGKKSLKSGRYGWTGRSSHAVTTGSQAVTRDPGLVEESKVVLLRETGPSVIWQSVKRDSFVYPVGFPHCECVFGFGSKAAVPVDVNGVFLFVL